MKKIISLLLILALIFTFCACSGKPSVNVDMLGIDFSVSGNDTTLTDFTANTSNPVAAMLLDGYGAVVVELYPDVAPNTVNNFISLIKSGFYDNNTVHRADPGFVIQGGDPTGSGNGGPGYSIAGEFTENGFKNDLAHTAGVISMARTKVFDSAGSQFFIMLGTSTSLDGKYAAFGKVIAGMDAVYALAENEEVSNPISGTLVNNVTITKMLVDLNGYAFTEPTKIS
ncbi:MAG: peptidylprolyl isomerase [Ruminococcaceae bacterium]|nr:peptidylprolyl isomerase [Oscillospiraceae bacterium]